MEERKTNRLVFWQNMPSHHQAEYIVSLAVDHGYEVIWAVEQGVEGTIRSEMGWPEFESAGVHLVVGPGTGEIDKIVNHSPETSLHIFSGVYFNSHVRSAFLKAIKTKAKIALMAESPVPAGLLLDTETKSPGARLRFLVPIIHRAFKFAFGRRIQSVFCIGKLSREWYTKLGYSPTQIVPWAYFPPAPTSLPNPVRDSRPTFVYMGFLASHKGIDVAVNALKSVKGDWKLICIGEGPLGDSLKQVCSECGLSDRCEFVGFLPWKEAMAILESADYALVPSRYDGWGAVVSEALMRGVRVLVSDHAGACDLVTHADRGKVIPSGSVPAWRDALQNAVDSGKASPEMIKTVFDWSSRITGSSGASYFKGVVQAMDHDDPKPIAPWFV